MFIKGSINLPQICLLKNAVTDAFSFEVNALKYELCTPGFFSACSRLYFRLNIYFKLKHGFG